MDPTLPSIREARTTEPACAGPTLYPGVRFGRFLIRERLGAGGMGVVFRAHDEVLGREVAIKVVRTHAAGGVESAFYVQRLQREARAAAAIAHPNIVTIYDVGAIDEVPFIAMELVRGRTLRQALSEGLSQTFALQVLREVAGALGAAHIRGIVHRDIKPDNILIADSGCVKVVDFGIARAFEGSLHAGEVTGEGVVVGSPRYMAPEQLRGDALDGRTDQFAWGVVAYELLYGGLPWDASSGPDLIASILRGTPRPPPPGHNPEIARVVLRCLSRHRWERFADMDELLRACEATDAFSGVPTRAEGVRRRRRSRRLHPVVRGAVVLALASAVTLGSVALPRGVRAYRGTSGSAAGPWHSPELSWLNDLRATATDDVLAHALRRATRLWTDGAVRQALIELELTASDAPTEAAPHVAYMLFADRAIDADLRQHFGAAVRARDTLSERGRAVLDALAPSMGDPVDMEATRLRLTSLAEAQPSSIELVLALATRAVLANEELDAERWTQLALRGAPDRAVTWLYRARALAKAGHLDGARGAYDRCNSLSPSATSCRQWRAKLEAAEGACAAAQRESRGLIALAPNDPAGFAFLARSLAGPEGSALATRTALESRWASTDAAEREWTRLQDNFYLAVDDGHFAEAEGVLEQWERESRRFTDADHRGYPAVARLHLSLELGSRERTASFARAYLEESRAWTDAWDIVFDIEALRALYASGELDRASFLRERDAWFARAGQTRRGYDDVEEYRWYEAFVEPVATEADARDALANRCGAPMTDPELRTVQADERYGEMFRRAGMRAEARAHLDRAVAACAYNRPFHRAHAELERAALDFEEGLTEQGCARLRRLRSRWGKEPGSLTIARANQMSDASGCKVGRVAAQ